MSNIFYDILVINNIILSVIIIIIDEIVIHLILFQTLTSSFRQYDTDMDGVITIHYEQFLQMVFSLKI